MHQRVKRALRRAFQDRIWIDDVPRGNDVAELIEKLKPSAVPGGLKRFGNVGDGGYLMPDDLGGVVASVSPGVSTECSFDEEVAARGIDVIMADASVDGPPSKNPRFHFLPKFVDINASDQTVTIDELVSASMVPPEGDLILQMDIEGAEYRVLASLSDDLLKRFRIVIIEFHNLDLMFSRFAFQTIIKPVFEKLTTFHKVVHIHPNNCSRLTKHGSLSVPPVMEFTFYRKDRTPNGGIAPLAFPHPLDADCVPHLPTLVLPDCWRH